MFQLFVVCLSRGVVGKDCGQTWDLDPRSHAAPDRTRRAVPSSTFPSRPRRRWCVKAGPTYVRWDLVGSMSCRNGPGNALSRRHRVAGTATTFGTRYVHMISPIFLSPCFRLALSAFFRGPPTAGVPEHCTISLHVARPKPPFTIPYRVHCPNIVVVLCLMAKENRNQQRPCCNNTTAPRAIEGGGRCCESGHTAGHLITLSAA